MAEEIDALYSNGTWEFVALPLGKSPVGCRWVYIVKVRPDGKIDRLKTVWLPRGTLSNMARTIMIFFLWWPRLPLFACFFL